MLECITANIFIADIGDYDLVSTIFFVNLPEESLSKRNAVGSFKKKN